MPPLPAKQLIRCPEGREPRFNTQPPRHEGAKKSTKQRNRVVIFGISARCLGTSDFLVLLSALEPWWLILGFAVPLPLS
jgi:hypothetical protein